jgi:hypothetical protein
VGLDVRKIHCEQRIVDDVLCLQGNYLLVVSTASMEEDLITRHPCLLAEFDDRELADISLAITGRSRLRLWVYRSLA